MSVCLVHPAFPPVKREVVDFPCKLTKQREVVSKCYYSTMYLAASRLHETSVGASLLQKKKGYCEEHIVAPFRSPRIQIEVHKERVIDHFHGRIQLFFNHLITCWNTPFEYSIQGANEQFGKGNNITLRTLSGEVVEYQTRAAHISTLPGLLAKTRGKDEGWFVYLKGSYTSNQHNATTEFDTCLNKTDSLVDGTANEKDKLRYKAVQLINQVAARTLMVKTAMEQYITDLIKVCGTRAAKIGVQDIRYEILVIYLSEALGVQEAMRTNPAYFDTLVGVHLEGDPQESRLRSVVFAQRFKLIQATQLIESQIACVILNANNAMTGKKTSSLAKVDAHLRYLLLKASEGHHRTCLSRLFCVSIEQLMATQAAAKPLKQSSAFENQHGEDISKLSRELRVYMRQINQLEMLHRSEILRAIRSVRGWTQRETANRYKLLFPNDSMSPSTYHRFESFALPNTKAVYLTPESTRKKTMPFSSAEKFAITFGIDLGLLLPNLISSTY